MKYCIPRVVPPPGSLYRLVGDPYKPSFPTVTGRGHNPMHTLFVGKETTSISSMLHHAPSHLHLLCRHIPNVNALVGWGHLIGHFSIFRVLHLSVEPILKQTTATYQKIDTTMLYKSTTFSYFSHIYISHFSGKTKRFTNTGVGTSSKSPECFTKTVPERTALDSPKINSFFFSRKPCLNWRFIWSQTRGTRNKQTLQKFACNSNMLQVSRLSSVVILIFKNQNIALFMQLATCGYTH